MHPVEVKTALESMVILVDSREQDTPRLRARLHQMGVPYERCKLDFGDYSVKCDRLSLANSVTVERKMSIDELCNCYCKDRGRFEREFERAKAAGAKIILMVEGATWEDIYGGKYRSKMKPQSLVASILAWQTRYDCQIFFCKPDTTGLLIKDTLQRELKERLEKMPDEEIQGNPDT